MGRIINRRGTSAIRPGLREFYIERRPDGRCIFQYNYMGKWLCGLQDIKPGACKRWPFRIFRESKLGNRKDAIFKYKKNTMSI